MRSCVLALILPSWEILVPVSGISKSNLSESAYTPILLALSGVGLRVYQENNVIIRNLVVSKVLADAGDAIGIQEANNVWVDHLELSSDLDHDKDYYDGLLVSLCILLHTSTLKEP